MNVKIRAACGCNMGKIRRNNEDNFYFSGVILPQENIGMENILYAEKALQNQASVFGVFDGMGGEADGQIASYLSCEILEKNLQSLTVCPEYTEKNYEYMIQLMNDAVCKEADARFNRMGCTAAMLMFHENNVYLSNLGDSPIFRLRNQCMEQISVDHTDAEMLKKQGITKRKPHLTQCIGIPADEMQLQPYFYEDKTETGDRYLICSDGLTDMVSNEEIKKILMEVRDVEACVICLIEKALKGGGRDNITVLLVDVMNNDGALGKKDKATPVLKSPKKPQVQQKELSTVQIFFDDKTEKQPIVETKKMELMPNDKQKESLKEEQKQKKIFLVSLIIMLLIGSCIGFFIGAHKDEKSSKKEVFSDVEVTPTEVEPTEVEPTEVEPTEVEPTEVTPTEVTPTEVEPTEVEPTEVTPTEVTPTEMKPTKELQESVEIQRE